MILSFVGHGPDNLPCTSTLLDVTEITCEGYGDPEIDKEKSAFQGPVRFFILNEDTIGFARNFGGSSKMRGHYVHNRLFKRMEDVVQHLQLAGTGNTAEKYVLVRLAAGTRVAIGHIANGKGMQARVSSADTGALEFDRPGTRRRRNNLA